MIRAMQWRMNVQGRDFLAEMPQAAADELAAALGEPFRVVRRWRGATADCYLVALEHSAKRLVVKRPFLGGFLEPEIRALQAASARGLADEGLVPRLHTVLADGHGYVADYVPGLTVDKALTRGQRERVAKGLTEALLRYHAGTGVAFGDFHHRNVIVRRNGMSLIDPSIPPAKPTGPGTGPLVADLATWTADICAYAPIRLVTNPVRTWRRLRLTVDLLVEAAVLSGGSRDGAAAVSAEAKAILASWMRTSAWRRDRLTYRPARLAVGLIGWRASRRLAGPAPLVPGGATMRHRDPGA